MLRNSWIGLGVLLAYWPDVLEWGLLLCDVRLPHAAPASLPAATISVLAITLVLRGALHETSRIALLVAGLLIASHTLLDGVSGGIPLWWPIDASLVGPDWIRLDNLPMARRLRIEALIFVPAVAIGLMLRTLRRHAAPLASGLAVGLTIASLASAICGSVVGVLAATAVLILAECVQLDRLDPRWTLNLLPLVPVIALGVVQIHAWRQINAGLAAMQRGDFEAGLYHNQQAARFRPVDLEAAARYRVAECQMRLGRFEEAHAGFSSGRRDFPGNVIFLDGLAQVYLAADLPALQRPREALILAEQAQAASRDPAYRKWIQQFIDQARAAAEGRSKP